MVIKEITVKCPICGTEDVIKHGIQNGKQVYQCKNSACPRKFFSESYTKKGWIPKVRENVLRLTVEGNGIRATARLLGISKNTVMAVLKKQEDQIWNINYDYINKRLEENPEITVISVDQIEVREAEMDEMWSFVKDKSQQCWLWWAIDHATGEPLAFCLGTREHKYLDELLEQLSAFQINTVYVDRNYAYEARIPDEVIPGKRNTQRIERKHLSLRTWCSRLVRKGIRFSKSHQMHKIVVGLLINVWFFGRTVVDFVV